MIIDAFLSYLRTENIPFLLDESMSNHTSFRIGGPVDVMILPKTSDQILGIVAAARRGKVPLFVIGNGTKLLVSDKGIRGAAVKISKNLSKVSVSGETITAEAGTLLPDLVRTAEQQAMAGLEFAAGIPGTLGGAIFMNAGTPDGEIKNIVREVTAINVKTAEIVTMSNEQCEFAYRESAFQKQPMIILKAKLSFVTADKEKIRNKIDALIAERMRTQPLDKPNAGSIFRNPPGSSAGKLIETSGLKGMTIGSAQISMKHANFIINLGNAKYGEVCELIKRVQAEVKARHGIELRLELRLIGE